jgi:hypothetical protein
MDKFFSFIQSLTYFVPSPSTGVLLFSPPSIFGAMNIRALSTIPSFKAE